MLHLLAKDQEAPPNFFDAIVFDGAAVVHLLPVTNIGTFDEYASIPYILKQLETSAHVDVVWDVYISDIKASTRERRGKGIRRKVAGKNKVPAKWMDFLRDESNKQELFAFISSKIVAYDEYPEGKKVQGQRKCKGCKGFFGLCIIGLQILESDMSYNVFTS